MSLYLQLSPYSVLSVRRKQYGTGEYDQDGTNNRASFVCRIEMELNFLGFLRLYCSIWTVQTLSY